MLRPALLVLLAAAAALAGGCASGRVRAANDYVSAVNGAYRSFAGSERLLGSIEPGSSGPRVRITLRRLYASVDTFAARLRAIRPPAAVRALHGRLVTAMQQFERSLRTAGAALVSGDAVRVLDGQQQLAAAAAGVSQRLNRTVVAINAALRR